MQSTRIFNTNYSCTVLNYKINYIKFKKKIVIVRIIILGV